MSPGITASRVEQASYYYMGHFSRYLVPGAKRVQVSNTVEVEIPQVTAADIKNGASRPLPGSLPRSSFKNPPPLRLGGVSRCGVADELVSGNLGPSRAIWAHLGPLEREASVTFRGAGAALLFEPCDAASAVQQFRFATASLIADKIAASLIANGTDDAQASDGSRRPPASCVFDGSSSGVGARLGRVPARRRVRRALHHAGMLVPEGAVVGVRRRRRGGPRGGAGRRACAPRLFTRAAVNRRTTAGAGTRSGTCSR